MTHYFFLKLKYAFSALEWKKTYYILLYHLFCFCQWSSLNQKIWTFACTISIFLKCFLYHIISFNQDRISKEIKYFIKLYYFHILKALQGPSPYTASSPVFQPSSALATVKHEIIKWYIDLKILAKSSAEIKPIILL